MQLLGSSGPLLVLKKKVSANNGVVHYWFGQLGVGKSQLEQAAEAKDLFGADCCDLCKEGCIVGSTSAGVQYFTLSL